MGVHQDQMAVERDISDFRRYVGELGRKVHDAGALWKDEKYRELGESVSRMASDSRAIIAKNEQCRRAVNRFMAVCREG